MTATPVPIPSDADERAWADLLAALLRREDLGPADTAWAMGKVMDGEATAVELAGFLVALRAKGETAQEVQGLVTAMLDRAALAEIALPVEHWRDVADGIGTLIRFIRPRDLDPSLGPEAE